MAKEKRWVVTTSGDRALKDVRKELVDAGFNVEKVLDAIGCITGTAEDNVAKKARNIPGVVDVSPEQSIDIGPPDAPVTW